MRLTMVQLSAFNTPQFEWGRTTLTKRPRPMGKIYQPEVGARAVYHAALHPRRDFRLVDLAHRARALGQRRAAPFELRRVEGRQLNHREAHLAPRMQQLAAQRIGEAAHGGLGAAVGRMQRDRAVREGRGDLDHHARSRGFMRRSAASVPQTAPR